MSEDEKDTSVGTGDCLQCSGDVNLEKEGVRKLLDYDEKLTREVTLQEWIPAGDVVSPRNKNNSKPLKQKSITDSGINCEGFVTGWIPDKTRVFRKVRKEHSAKSKDPLVKESHSRDRYWRDIKHKSSVDKFVFKHYRDTRKYMEQYRREHSCGATIHITKRVLSPRASGNTTCSFPRKVQVYQVYSPNRASLKESWYENAHYSSRGMKGSKENLNSETAENISCNNSQKTETNGKHERSFLRHSPSADPTVIFKYKLAPHYVQGLLEQHRQLQRQKPDLNNKQYMVKRHMNSTNGHTEKGNVSPFWDDSSLDSHLVPVAETEVRGKQCSTRQRPPSGKRVAGNLAPTKITISPLPSVPIIVSQTTSDQTSLSALAEKVSVNQNYKGNPPVLPSGNTKTLENLSKLTTGEKESQKSSDSDVSLSQLSTTCIRESREVSDVSMAPVLSVVVNQLLPSEESTLVVGKQRAEERTMGEDSKMSSKAEDVDADNKFDTLKEKVLQTQTVKSAQYKDFRPVLVKFMSKEGKLRQALIDLRGDNPKAESRIFDSLSNDVECEEDDIKEGLSQVRSEVRASVKTPDGRNRQVKSAGENVGRNGGKGILKRRSKTSCNLSQPKPPPVPFFKFWGGSLPPEARCHLKQDSSRTKSSQTQKSSSSNTTTTNVDTPREGTPSGNMQSRKSSSRSTRKQKRGPAVATGALPWKQKLELLKFISQQSMKSQEHSHHVRVPRRSLSLTLPKISEEDSLDDCSHQPTGHRSNRAQRSTSAVSLSRPSSLMRGILSNPLLLSKLFSGNGNPETTAGSNLSAPLHRESRTSDLRGDCTPQAGSELGACLNGRTEGSVQDSDCGTQDCDTNISPRTDHPEELCIKCVHPKTKLDHSFLPDIPQK